MTLILDYTSMRREAKFKNGREIIPRRRKVYFHKSFACPENASEAERRRYDVFLHELLYQFHIVNNRSQRTPLRKVRQNLLETGFFKAGEFSNFTVAHAICGVSTIPLLNDACNRDGTSFLEVYSDVVEGKNTPVYSNEAIRYMIGRSSPILPVAMWYDL